MTNRWFIFAVLVFLPAVGIATLQMPLVKVWLHPTHAPQTPDDLILDNALTFSYQNTPGNLRIETSKGHIEISFVDGEVTLPDGLTVHAASRRFWRLLQRISPEMCARQKAK